MVDIEQFNMKKVNERKYFENEKLLLRTRCNFPFKQLSEEKEFIISKQFTQSATSVGANIRGGGDTENPKYFIHKMSISLKECSESQYGLDLLKDSSYISLNQYEKMFDQAE